MKAVHLEGWKLTIRAREDTNAFDAMLRITICMRIFMQVRRLCHTRIVGSFQEGPTMPTEL